VETETGVLGDGAYRITRVGDTIIGIELWPRLEAPDVRYLLMRRTTTDED